jgi:hypothetical protein
MDTVPDVVITPNNDDTTIRVSDGDIAPNTVDAIRQMPQRTFFYRLRTAIHADEIYTRTYHHTQSIHQASAMSVQRFQFAQYHAMASASPDGDGVGVGVGVVPALRDPQFERLKVLAWPRVPDGGAHTIRMSFRPQNVVPLYDDIQLYTELVRGDIGNYGLPTEELRERAQAIIDQHGLDMTADQAISFRQALIREKHQLCSRWVVNHSMDLHDMYFNRGLDAVDIANQYDISPLQVLGAALAIKQGSAEHLVGKCMHGVLNADELQGRDLEQFRAARERDCVQSHVPTETDFSEMEAIVRSRLHGHQLETDSETDSDELPEDLQEAMQGGFAKLHGSLFELDVREFLDSHGIRYMEEKDIRSLQEDLEGPLITPDFVLLDRVVINGAEVAWIDAKLFYGPCLHWTFNKLSRQAQKYNDVWGCGAFLFKHGYSEGMLIPGAIALDFRSVSEGVVTSTRESLVFAPPRHIPVRCHMPEAEDVDEMEDRSSESHHHQLLPTLPPLKPLHSTCTNNAFNECLTVSASTVT